jgi:predicted permease
VSVDRSVLAFTVLVAGIVTVLIAVIPASIVAKGQLQSILLSGGRNQTNDRRHGRLRSMLVVTQVALAVVLCASAALITKSFSRLMSVDAGYDPSGVVAAEVTLFDHPQAAQFYRQLHWRLRAVPGVEAVGLIQSTPLTGKWTFRDPFVIVGSSTRAEDAPRVSGSFAAFDYFAAMKIPVIAGRVFTEAEVLEPDAPVIVINESTARRFFPGRSPLGERVMLAGKARSIIGVVRDTRDMRLDVETEPQWYQPLIFEGSQLIVRVSGDPSGIVPRIREVLAADSRLVINRIDLLTDIVAGTVVERRMAMRLLAVFAYIALALATIGLYGVMSFSVARREREFGVRSALGAQRSTLLGMVLRHGVGLAGVGIAVGLVASLWVTRALEQLLFAISPTDAVTMWTIAGMILLIAATASLVPAWRAASADPLQALRAD